MVFKNFFNITNYINDGSGWVVQTIKSQYINISTCRLLSRSSYVKLPAGLRNPKKGLVNIKNNDQKFFFWCHVRHMNPVKIHLERTTQNDKKLVNDFEYDGLGFLCEKIFFTGLKQKTTFALM